MRARWASFAVGLWLILAPLALGYPSVASVLHDIALGLLVSVGALAAMEWPAARITLVVPGLWLLAAWDAIDWGSSTVAANELACGVAIPALALVPSSKTASAPAKMAA
jgi:hypothetical protein